MKLLISPRLRQNSPLEVQTISAPIIGFDTARKSRLATEKPTEACSMYQVIPWHKKVSGWGSAALAQPPESLEIIRWYLDERASSTQYKFYRRLKA